METNQWERVALIRLKLNEKTLPLVQVDAQNTESQYAPFLDEVLRVLDGIPRTDSIILLADFNAHVGNDAQTWKGVLTKNGDTDIYAQGTLLRHLCAGGRLSIMNTFFHHKYTWDKLADSATQKSLIDLFVVSDDRRKSVMDVCVNSCRPITTWSCANCHWPRRAECKWLTKRDRTEYDGKHCFTRQFGATLQKMSTKDSPTYHRRRSTLKLSGRCFVQRYFELRQKHVEWSAFGLSIGQKRTPCVEWRSPRCSSWQESCLQRPGEVGKQRKLARKYLQARDKTKEVVAKAKAASSKNFGHRLQSDYLSAGKVFWQTIRRLRKGPSTIICSIKNAIGDLLSRENDILNRWKEYFMELDNPTSARRGAPSEPERDETSDISTDEVQAAIRALNPANAAPIDEILTWVGKVSQPPQYPLALEGVSRSLEARKNSCGLANENCCPYLQKGRPDRVIELQRHYSVKSPWKSLCNSFGEEMPNDSRAKDAGHPMWLSHRTTNNWAAVHTFAKSSRRPGNSPSQFTLRLQTWKRPMRSGTWRPAVERHERVGQQWPCSGSHSVFVQWL